MSSNIKSPVADIFSSSSSPHHGGHSSSQQPQQGSGTIGSINNKTNNNNFKDNLREAVIPAHIRLQNSIRSALLTSSYEQQQKEIRQQNLAQHQLFQFFQHEKIENEFIATVFYGPQYFRLILIDIVVILCYIIVGVNEYFTFVAQPWQLKMNLMFRIMVFIPAFLSLLVLCISKVRLRYPYLIEAVHLCSFLIVENLQLLAEMVIYKPFPIYTPNPPLFYPEGVVVISCVFNIFARYVSLPTIV